MSKIIRNNDKVTKYNIKIIKFTNPIYNVIVNPSQNGSVIATPNSGSFGTIVTLSNTPDTNYELDRYELTGASLITSNTFSIKKQDVAGIARATTNEEDVEIKNILMNQSA